MGHYSWPAYHTNTELYAEWDKIDADCPAMKLETLDTTVDGWPLKTATFGSGGGNKTKIMFIFGIHGREYLGGEIGLALMKKLCNPEKRTRSILSSSHIKFFPLMNPSGRAGNLAEKKIKEQHKEECVL